MKTSLIAIALTGLLLSFSGNADAQVYDVYYYWDGIQYQQYWPQYDLYSYGDTNQYPEQQYDPYYQLHVIHYQLYLPQYQYGVCCLGGGIVIPRRHRVTPPNLINPTRPTPIRPQRLVTPFPQFTRR